MFDPTEVLYVPVPNQWNTLDEINVISKSETKIVLLVNTCLLELAKISERIFGGPQWVLNFLLVKKFKNT